MENALNVCLAAARLILMLSLKAAVLIAFFLPIRAVFTGKGQARFNRLLWLILIASLLVPLGIETAVSPANLLRLTGFIRRASDADPGLTVRPAPPQPADADPTDRSASVADRPRFVDAPAAPYSVFLFALVWLAGVMGAAAKLGANQRRLNKRLRACTPITRPDVIRLCGRLGAALRLRSRVRLLESDDFGAPFVGGFFRPALVLPRRLSARLTQGELECVLAHELAHLKRKDAALLAVMALLTALHWFNPLVWLAAHCLRRDLEYDCDAAALAVLGEGRSRRYGEAVLRVAVLVSRRPAHWGALGMADDKRHLKRRMKMITVFKKKTSYRYLIGVALAAALAFWVGTKEAGADDRLIASPAKSVMFRSPVENPAVTLEFGWAAHPQTGRPFFHNGIDIAKPVGTPVTAAAGGVVAAVSGKPSDDYGNYVVLLHEGGIRTYYTKLEKILVRENQAVKAGELIALTGNTGIGTGPHLHFAITKDDRPLDPREYILF